MDQVQEERSPKQLRVFGILSEAIETIVNQHKRIAIALAVPFFVALWFQLYGVYVLEIDPNNSRSWINFVLKFLLAIAAVTCHRIVLLGADSVAKFGTSATENYFWRYILRGILMGLILFLLIIPLALIMPMFFKLLDVGSANQTAIEHLISLIVIAPVVVAFAYFFGQMSLVLPAAAIGRKLGIIDTFELSKGNAWKVAILVLGAPFIDDAVILLISQFIDGPTVILLKFIMQWLLLPFEIALLSLCYKHLSEARNP
ncbi:MAG: hypothetical protein ABUL58_01445 [Steroidobacter sp.]